MPQKLATPGRGCGHDSKNQHSPAIDVEWDNFVRAIKAALRWLRLPLTIEDEEYPRNPNQSSWSECPSG
jgi:hypothetical protein